MLFVRNAFDGLRTITKYCFQQDWHNDMKIYELPMTKGCVKSYKTKLRAQMESRQSC